MANGWSQEQMVEMILDGQKELKEDIKALTVKVDQVALFGCSHREDDLNRIRSLEAWKTRGIIGILTLFAGFIIELFTRR